MSTMICPKHKECDKKNKRTDANETHNRCSSHEYKKGYCDKADSTTCSTFCPPCIPYVREFKVGDRVRVLSRTLCGNSSITYSLEDCGVRIGDIVKIMSTRTCSHCKAKAYDISISGYTFHEQDLELITEEADMDKPKYKAVKHCSLASIYDGVVKSDCQEVFDHFSNLLWFLKESHFGNIINPTKLIEWAEQDPKRIKWLIEKGYIEEIKKSAYDKWVEECPKGMDGMYTSAYIKWAKRMPKED